MHGIKLVRIKALNRYIINDTTKQFSALSTQKINEMVAGSISCKGCKVVGNPHTSPNSLRPATTPGQSIGCSLGSRKGCNKTPENCPKGRIQ